MNRKDLALLGMGAALASRRTERVYERREIHEHRAPTDESVRLLKEMEEKAAKKVIKALTIQSNEWHCVVQAEVSHMDALRIMRAVFDINGKRMVAEVNQPEWKDDPQSRDLVTALRDEVARKIANEVLEGAFRAANPHKLFGLVPSKERSDT